MQVTLPVSHRDIETSHCRCLPGGRTPDTVSKGPAPRCVALVPVPTSLWAETTAYVSASPPPGPASGVQKWEEGRERLCHLSPRDVTPSTASAPACPGPRSHSSGINSLACAQLPCVPRAGAAQGQHGSQKLLRALGLLSCCRVRETGVALPLSPRCRRGRPGPAPMAAARASAGDREQPWRAAWAQLGMPGTPSCGLLLLETVKRAGTRSESRVPRTEGGRGGSAAPPSGSPESRAGAQPRGQEAGPGVTVRRWSPLSEIRQHRLARLPGPRPSGELGLQPGDGCGLCPQPLQLALCCLETRGGLEDPQELEGQDP
ncbi:translation initiation factor IF-2-like [Sciurus carolinensis]|uniref:translation initiation factor IF-2-like n=1 Tax=Sciurus carolinensis TaxID=30640 RepID=UPI001FB4E4CB|nr:translation initiation factor IF-2-like [Sciurus carolinensis]